MGAPLQVAFVWHMHQPFYKDTRTQQYSLPWVRLHAVKDYLHIARLIADYPKVHQTINVVPSLAQQLQEYGIGTAVDSIAAICNRAIENDGSLYESDKREVLAAFFSLNWEHFLLPVPRFAQLARIREIVNGDVGLLSDQYFVDLMVWYNLAWVDPSLRASIPRLASIESKGLDFQIDDLVAVLDEHQRICAEVLPYYRELESRGQVELTTSPYFHPILPLLIDSSSGREASPFLSVPSPHFAFPGDARKQISDGVAFHASLFGRPPRGMWPSEGAISQATVELIGEFPQIRWIASDEQVLGRSLGQGFDRDGFGQLRDPYPLYQPYVSKAGGPGIFFRDQELSDRVGFVYQGWNGVDAANDLVERLLISARTLERSKDRSVPPIASIILDGENCWEFYANNGDDFLRHLFKRLGDEPLLKTVTPSEYLANLDGGRSSLTPLSHIPAASWIASNLETWIGEPDQNRAWEYLLHARSRLQARDTAIGQSQPGARSAAWHALFVAEGSDWFWWYYSRNHTGGEGAFDVRFRQQLANIYVEINEDVPAWLARPIVGQSSARRRSATASITLDRLCTDHDAAPIWSDAAYLEPELATGSMQVGQRDFRRLYYGSNSEDLYLRIEFVSGYRSGRTSAFFALIDGESFPLAPYSSDSGPVAAGNASNNAFAKLDLPRETTLAPVFFLRESDGTWVKHDSTIGVAVGVDSCEVRIPWHDLSQARLDRVVATVVQLRDGQVVESLPTTDPIGPDSNTADDEATLSILP